MSTSGGAGPSQTTTAVLSPQQRQIMDLAMPGIEDFAATVPQQYPGAEVAPFNATQQQGQQMALAAAAGPQSELVQAGADANKFLLTDIWNPETNPHLQGAIDAATRGITRNYQTNVRPAIRDDFQQAGQQFGGSRRNIAEAIAADDYLSKISDAASRIVQDQYGNNLNAYVKALGLIPQTTQAQLLPALTTSGVGDVQHAMEQAQLNEQVSDYYYNELAPYLQSKELLSLVAGIPGGSTVTTSTTAAPNPAMSALGGAATGASLGSAIPGIGTGVGAVAGGGLGLLLSYL